MMIRLIQSFLFALSLVSEMTHGGRVRRQPALRQGCSELGNCIKVGEFLGKVAYQCGTKYCLVLPSFATTTTTTTSTTTTPSPTTTITTTTTTPTTTTPTTTTTMETPSDEKFEDENWMDVPDPCVVNYYDRVIQDIKSTRLCKKLCIKETRFECRSIEYNAEVKVCHLSKQNSWEKPISDPCNHGKEWIFADRAITDPEPIKVCADIVFVLDFSCSVPRKDRLKGIQLIDQLEKRLILNTTGGAWFGVVPFSKKVIREQVWRFPPANKKDQSLHSFIDLYDISQPCRTRIRFAFQFANESFFKEPNDRNDDEYKDLIIVVGDGRTSPRPPIEKKLSIDYANALTREQGIQIAWVKTNTVLVNRKKIFGLETAIALGDTEIADIVPNPALRFSLDQERERLNNNDAVEGILEYIRDNFNCNQ
ncbi:unnamed protein product [Owenia fusiformis]|uniref:Uncharacterized protein n=1 Tax=Owenia fusiformis TaxID=6347 RepID=A0A8J1XPD6_OWEFU|nr:unnamed protein product [Owenia fusiformis]